MDELAEVLRYILRPGTFTVAVCVFVITFFIKRIVLVLAPHWKKQAKEMDSAPMYSTRWSLWWNEVILYAIPVIVGALFGLSGSTFINADIDTRGAKVMFNAGVGWFSGFLYKALKKIIQQRTGVTIGPDSLSPPAE